MKLSEFKKYIGFFWLVALLFAAPARAQMIDFAVQSVDFYEEVKIKVVEFYEDEKWQVVGACSNMPNLKAKFVDFYEDVKIRIVDFYADRKVCITNVEDLAVELRQKLGL